MFNDNVFSVFDFAQEFLSLYKLSSNFFADKHYYWQLYKCRDNLTSTCLSMTLNLIDLPWVFSYNYERMNPVFSYCDNAIKVRLRFLMYILIHTLIGFQNWRQLWNADITLSISLIRQDLLIDMCDIYGFKCLFISRSNSRL